MWGSVGICGGCEKAIYGEKTGCSALGKAYHMDCFKCIVCGKSRSGDWLNNDRAAVRFPVIDLL